MTYASRRCTATEMLALQPKDAYHVQNLLFYQMGNSLSYLHPSLFGYSDNCPPPPEAYNCGASVFLPPRSPWSHSGSRSPTSPYDCFPPTSFDFPVKTSSSRTSRGSDSRMRVTEYPQKIDATTFSRKVFVGGLPVNLPRIYVESIFSKYGEVTVDWPRPSSIEGKGKSTAATCNNSYVFLMYANHEAVARLLDDCGHKEEKYWFQIRVGSVAKSVQIRPWSLRDINYIPDPEAMVDTRNTVFVGGVPRPATAEQLATLLEKNYGKVLFASIDIDPEQQYPKGAGRVIFADQLSYLRAIRGRFVKMDSQERHHKEIEIKPYVVEGQSCDECGGKFCDKQFADYFCSDPSCLQYYCIHCFDATHSEPRRSGHRVVVREGERTKEVNELPHRSASSSSSRDDEMLFSMDHYLFGPF